MKYSRTGSFSVDRGFVFTQYVKDRNAQDAGAERIVVIVGQTLECKSLPAQQEGSNMLIRITTCSINITREHVRNTNFHLLAQAN